MSVRALVCLLGMVFAQMIPAGDRGGHGGDDVRANFLLVGGAVVNYLKTSGAGRQLVQRQQLNLALLERTLTIEVISTGDFGSATEDARVRFGSVELNKVKWQSYFDRGLDIYYLAFHYMLLATGRDDSSFIISRALIPFPLAYKVNFSASILRDTRHLSYGERRRYLERRGQDLVVRLAERGREDLVRQLVLPRFRLSSETPAQLPSGQSPVPYSAILDAIEAEFNRLERAM